jgi:uncharacterized protein
MNQVDKNKRTSQNIVASTASPLTQLIERIKPRYMKYETAHNFSHILRVVASVEKLAKHENANLETLLPAAYLHDIVNLPKNHPKRSEASAMAAKEGVRLLEDINRSFVSPAWSGQLLDDIYHIILEHSYSRGSAPTSLEAAILQDADRLDALGAVGIMRTVACGVSMGAAFYDPLDPLAHQRAYDDKSFTMDHFFVKLFKLPELMNTQSAKIEALSRVDYMREFLQQLLNELGHHEIEDISYLPNKSLRSERRF